MFSKRYPFLFIKSLVPFNLTFQLKGVVYCNFFNFILTWLYYYWHCLIKQFYISNNKASVWSVTSEEKEFVDKLHFELHLKRYNYRGIRTKLEKLFACVDIHINPLDETWKEHDVACIPSKCVLALAETDVLLSKVWKRLLLLCPKPTVGFGDVSWGEQFLFGFLHQEWIYKLNGW